MNSQIAEGFLKHTDEIMDIVHNFHERGKPFGDGDRNTIRLFELDNITVNVKKFKVPNAVNKVAYKYLRKSKARRSFENAHYLLSKGIGTPTPIAFFENFNPFGIRDSYYMSEHLKCDLTFRELVENPNYPDRDEILAEFTKFTFQLHAQGILFKDHSPGNTLIRKTETGYNFYLVDLNRMAFKELSFNERMKNFSRLTPKKEMIQKMSETYASLINREQQEVFDQMWKHTDEFQQAYFRKRKLKKKLFFWKKY